MSDDLIVTAVDRARVRAGIGRLAHTLHSPACSPVLWLDTGNGAFDGQVVLGHWRARRADDWIPNVFQLYPELAGLDDQAQRAPSCSAAESLARQWLPMNRIVAGIAQNLLWMLFRQGRLDIHGAVINLASLSVHPLRADPQAWASFGWRA